MIAYFFETPKRRAPKKIANDIERCVAEPLQNINHMNSFKVVLLERRTEITYEQVKVTLNDSFLVRPYKEGRVQAPCGTADGSPHW